MSGAPAENARPLQAFLQSTSLFGCLAPEMVAGVEGALRERRLQAGEVLFNEGDTGTSMYLVREGTLIVQRHHADGTQARLLLMRPGDFVGITSLVEMEPRPFSCRAETDALLYELTNADLYRLYKSDPKAYLLVLQNINRELCRRLRKAARRISELEDALHAAASPRTE